LRRYNSDAALTREGAAREAATAVAAADAARADAEARARRAAGSLAEVGRCRLIVSIPVLKALEASIR